MTAANSDLIIERGHSFAETVTYKDSSGTAVDLSSYTASLFVREDFDTSINLLSLTSSSGLTLGGTAGTIAIAITPTQTATLPKYFRGRYDLIVVSNAGVKTRLLEGNILVKPGISS